MKSAAGEKLWFSEPQKGTSCRKAEMKLPWCTAWPAERRADTQQHWLAHQHQGCAYPLLWGHNNCIASGKQALLNCSEHTSTPGTADAPDLAGLACCDPHTKSVRPGQEGQALKCHSITLSSEDNCFRKPGPESMRKTRNRKAEKKQRLIKNRALHIFKFNPWKRSRSCPSPWLYPLSHCNADHL